MQVNLWLTVWIFQDFSVILILREINFGEFRSSKMGYFAILGGADDCLFGNFSLQKVQNFIKIKIQSL